MVWLIEIRQCIILVCVLPVMSTIYSGAAAVSCTLNFGMARLAAECMAGLSAMRRFLCGVHSVLA